MAHARRAYPYLLDVPAARMSELVNQPADFLVFALRHQPGEGANDFLSREVYGSYLQGAFAEAVARSPRQISAEVVIDFVVALRRAQGGPNPWRSNVARAAADATKTSKPAASCDAPSRTAIG